MLQKKSLLILFSILYLAAGAQDARELHETGMKFLSQGDYDNAILVLRLSNEKEPANITYAKDLAFAYFLKGDAPNAQTTIGKLVDKEGADDQVYLLAGNIYQLSRELKDAEKIYRRGLKKFEKSGALYSAYGELLWRQQDYSAIKQWEKGIENDPEYPGNYYHASRHYFLTKSAEDKIWSVFYGEVFVNLESFSTRTVEIKNVVLESYKRLLQEKSVASSLKKGSFAEAFAQTSEKNTQSVALGVNAASLMALRTRFILEWYKNGTAPFACQLFDWHRQLLREGLFEAYHQWLFESVSNLAAFENWTQTHAAEYGQFTRFRQNKLFKIPAGQYYR
jgi:tetratricopeptide (TPR) repeat protein